MRFGELLKFLRQKKGISQYKLSEMIGYDRRTIILWEQGKHSPPVDEAVIVINRLGGNLNMLYDEEIANRARCETRNRG